MKGFGLGLAAVGFIVSLALESAIVGVGFFEELFIKPTPLPGLVKFANKALDWNASTITQRGLQVDVSPSPGTVNFASSGTLMNSFSGFGWSPSNPVDKAQDATVPDATDATVPNSPQPASDKVDATVQASQDATVPPAQISAMLERWRRAESAKVGDMIECATCGAETEKRIDTKRFCSAVCRKEYHRATNLNDR